MKSNFPNWLSWCTVFTIVCVIATFATPVICYGRPSSQYDHARWLDILGQCSSFGGMFGALGAIFSGLAFLGVLASYNLQAEELKLTKNAHEQLEKEKRAAATELANQRKHELQARIIGAATAIVQFHSGGLSSVNTSVRGEAAREAEPYLKLLKAELEQCRIDLDLQA